MSTCEEILGPGLAAYQELTDAGKFCELAGFDNNLAMICEGVTGEARNRALAAADQRMLCAVLCCCNNNPVVSDSGRNGYQTCADRTLSAAEQHMGNESRFKPEVSYNMRTSPPTPLMVRNRITGNLTTRTIPWDPRGIPHIQNRIGQDGTPYQQGDARRPDVIIVRNPELPPVQGNISRVVEFKFGDDDFSDAQQQHYRAIGGMPALELNADKCDCSNDEETQGQVALATAAQDARENDRSMAARIGWGIVGTVAALGTAALAIFPFDGPLGEIAAGAGTAAAFARAFSAVGWTAARSRAAAALSMQRWNTAFGGAL